MPSPRYLSILILLLLGALFAAANVWFAAARSTIPLELHGIVTQTQRLIEKTPGVDDVYILTLDSDQRIQIDGHIFDALAEGQAVHKAAWTRGLKIDDRTLALTWSRDFRGMMWAMPLTVAICVLLGMLVVVRPCRLCLRFDLPCHCDPGC